MDRIELTALLDAHAALRDAEEGLSAALRALPRTSRLADEVRDQIGALHRTRSRIITSLQEGI